VHPLDNPAFSAADRAHLAKVLEQVAPEETGTTSGALAAESGEPASAGGSGCGASSGPPAAVWFLLAGGLLAVRRRRRLAAGLGLLLALALAPGHASATTCYLQGTVALWDAVSTDYRSDVGSRRPWCDTTDTACRVTDADCCFEGLPRVKANLHKGSQSLDDIVLTTDGGSGGAFILWDTACSERLDYYVSFTFQRDGYPAKQVLRGQYPSDPYTVVYTEPVSLVFGQWINLGDVSLNAGGDTTSWAGDLASLWYTSHISFAAYEEEGTTRHRKTRGSANDYDLITTRYFWWDPQVDKYDGLATCPSDVKIRLGTARDGVIAHEMGHILHFRTVGCSAELVGFESPDKATGGVPEGSWAEGFAGFAGTLLTFLDPDTTVPDDLDDDDDTWCIDIGHDYANDMSQRRNQVRGLWELIDADTTGDNYEASELDLEDILAVMDSWQGTNTTCSGQTQGVNRSFCEPWAEATATGCNTVVDCGAPLTEGGVLKDWKCDGGYCWKGDVHGRNIRDLVYHIAQTTGQSESVYYNALTSSPCVGGVDNGYPFVGGYRGD
jgi:MYXO-CTERM domain-containing protein